MREIKYTVTFSAADGGAFLNGMRALSRRAQEAPLVALVNACPDGLDPNGWRAAVLAVHERYGGRVVYSAETMGIWIRFGSDMIAGVQAIAAYHRAIAPQGPRPQPYRRRAPGLPLDDGRDE